MKKMVKKMEKLLGAAAFAEVGEFDTAIQMAAEQEPDSGTKKSKGKNIFITPSGAEAHAN